MIVGQTKITLMISEREHERLKLESRLRGRSVAAIVRAAVTDFIDQQQTRCIYHGQDRRRGDARHKERGTA